VYRELKGELEMLCLRDGPWNRRMKFLVGTMRVEIHGTDFQVDGLVKNLAHRPNARVLHTCPSGTTELVVTGGSPEKFAILERNKNTPKQRHLVWV